MAKAQSLPILLVDDSPSTTAIIQVLLQQLGMSNVDVVNSGEAALRMIGMRNYGMIISDWHMQPVNGPDLLKAVRARPGNQKPKFIFITMDDRWSSMATARSMGADGFIVKPDNVRALKTKITAFVSAYQ